MTNYNKKNASTINQSIDSHSLTQVAALDWFLCISVVYQPIRVFHSLRDFLIFALCLQKPHCSQPLKWKRFFPGILLNGYHALVYNIQIYRHLYLKNKQSLQKAYKISLLATGVLNSPTRLCIFGQLHYCCCQQCDVTSVVNR